MKADLNKQLHALLNRSGLKEQKANLVAGFTKGRSESSSDMTDYEAIEMIAYLKEQTFESDGGQKMRRRIISWAHEMHWHVPGTTKADMKRINEWCIKFGKYHKPLNDHTAKELPTLVFQFETIYNQFISKI